MRISFIWTPQRRLYLAELILVYPTVSIIVIGTCLIISHLVDFLFVTLVSEVLVSMTLASIVIGAGITSKNPSRKLEGDAEPAWIRIRDVQFILMVFDLVMIILFLDLSRWSYYGETVAFYLMMLFLPMSYLSSTIFRNASLGLISWKFSFAVDKPSTVLWVSSSLAKVLLRLHRQSGIIQLKKSLVAARKLLRSAGRSFNSLDEAISLLDFIGTTGIEVEFDKLLTFTESIFGSYNPKLQMLPDRCNELIAGFRWFSKTEPLNNRKPSDNFFEEFKSLIKALGGLGIIGTLVTIFQIVDKSLPSIGLSLQSLLVVYVIFAGLFIFLLPALNLRALFGVVVGRSDLEAYEDSYLYSHVYETVGI